MAQSRFPQKRNTHKYIVFLDAHFHIEFSASVFVTHWNQSFRNVPQNIGTPKKFENVHTNLKNNCQKQVSFQQRRNMLACNFTKKKDLRPHDIFQGLQ